VASSAVVIINHLVFKTKKTIRLMNTRLTDLHAEERNTREKINGWFEILQSRRIWRRESILHTDIQSMHRS